MAFSSLFVACPEVTAVWIEDGSTAAHLVFDVADKHHGHGAIALNYLSVRRCGSPPAGDGVDWVMAGASDTAVHRIVYGEPPPGYHSVKGPKPIAPGCYHVSLLGTGWADFDVSASGAVTERPRRSATTSQ